MNNTLDATTGIKDSHASKPQRLTWKTLIALEPRLLALYREAKAIRDHKTEPRFCANLVWYGRGNEAGLKERVCALVGYQASDPRLQTSAAYDLAYHKVYDALPACRNCSCFPVFWVRPMMNRAKQQRDTAR